MFPAVSRVSLLRGCYWHGGGDCGATRVVDNQQAPRTGTDTRCVGVDGSLLIAVTGIADERLFSGPDTQSSAAHAACLHAVGVPVLCALMRVSPLTKS